MEYIYPNGPSSLQAAAFGDLETVYLTQDFRAPDGVVIRKGTLGVVLQVFRGGEAYQVEFEGEHHVPETVTVEETDQAPANPSVKATISAEDHSR